MAIRLEIKENKKKEYIAEKSLNRFHRGAKVRLLHVLSLSILLPFISTPCKEYSAYYWILESVAHAVSGR